MGEAIDTGSALAAEAIDGTAASRGTDSRITVRGTAMIFGPLPLVSGRGSATLAIGADVAVATSACWGVPSRCSGTNFSVSFFRGLFEMALALTFAAFAFRAAFERLVVVFCAGFLALVVLAFALVFVLFAGFAAFVLVCVFFAGAEVF
ncbi:MAG TPA: hypothetical protein VF395_20360, partial [Polyangiaceae bacterium]